MKHVLCDTTSLSLFSLSSSLLFSFFSVLYRFLAVLFLILSFTSHTIYLKTNMKKHYVRTESNHLSLGKESSSFIILIIVLKYTIFLFFVKKNEERMERNGMQWNAMQWKTCHSISNKKNFRRRRDGMMIEWRKLKKVN